MRKPELNAGNVSIRYFLIQTVPLPQIVNTYDQLKSAVAAGVLLRDQAVALIYSPSIPRQCQCARVTVYSPFFKTHPNPEKAHWSHYGNQVFIGNRAESLPAAKEWVAKRYGVTKWKGNRMRDQVPAIVQNRFPIPRGVTYMKRVSS